MQQHILTDYIIISDIKAKKINTIVALKLDRITRSILDWEKLITSFHSTTSLKKIYIKTAKKYVINILSGAQKTFEALSHSYNLESI